jgi:hypothetical protein
MPGVPALDRIFQDATAGCGCGAESARECLFLRGALLAPEPGCIRELPDGWPEPVGPEAFAGLAGRWALAVQPYTEASPAGVLVSTLVAFGNAAGGSCYAPVTATRHHLNEFALLVGPTGTARKSEAMRLGCRPLQLADTGWDSRIQRGFGSGEAIVEEVRDPIRGLKVDEEVILDKGAEDKRLLIHEDEFAHPLTVCARDGSTLSPLIRAAWDGVRLENRTKGKKTTATDAHISVLAGITADELARRVTESEIANGFLNRFLLVAVHRPKKLSRPRPIRGDIEDEYVRAFKSALRFARQGGPVDFDEAAGRRWDTAYEQELSVGRRGLAGTACARADAHTLRLAMLYALLDKSPAITVAHVESALALWSYCERSARFVFGESLGDPVADKILAGLRAAAAAGMTRSEIRTLIGGRIPEKAIEAALALIARHRLAEMTLETDTGGRPAERWTATREER